MSEERIPEIDADELIGTVTLLGTFQQAVVAPGKPTKLVFEATNIEGNDIATLQGLGDEKLMLIVRPVSPPLPFGR